MWAELNASVSAILERHVYWRHLLDHYAATRLQFALGHAMPILVSAVILLQRIVAGNHAEALGGDAQASLAEAIRNVSTRGHYVRLSIGFQSNSDSSVWIMKSDRRHP